MSSTIGATSESKQGWIARGEHLPPLLRTPEAQRALLAAMAEDEIFSRHLKPNGLSPAAGQEFVFGGFLQFMARYGFTLQRTRLTKGDMSADPSEQQRETDHRVAATSIVRQMSPKRHKALATMDVSSRAVELLQRLAVKKSS